jgi:serine/threonine protein kinase
MEVYKPGTRIGQYEVVSKPMMGGMGVVYFSFDHGNDDRLVALKSFRPELLPDRAARDRFLREGTAWVDLGSYPHIVRCYKVEYFDPIAFLVLELISKEHNMSDASLRPWLLAGRPLPLEQALPFVMQIARGMRHATEKIPGFVHRDLKPENILVGADKLPGTNINRLRVTDFGLVKTMVDSGVPVTTNNTEELKPTQVQFTIGVGTPLYMAPEQWKGEPVGIFTDVYAFGCILYEMLSGQFAAEGKSVNDLQRSHCSGMLRPLSSEIPKAIAAVLAKCLASNPSLRFTNWNEIIDELNNAILIQSDMVVPEISVSLENEHDLQIQKGWSYHTLGLAFDDLGKADQSVKYFEKMLTISKEETALDLEATALNSLGDMHRILGNTQKAIDYLKQSITILRKCGNWAGEIAVLSNLGNVYQKIGEISQAIELYDQYLVSPTW